MGAGSNNVLVHLTTQLMLRGVHAYAEDSVVNMGWGVGGWGSKEIHTQGIVLQTFWQSQLEPKGSRDFESTSTVSFGDIMSPRTRD